ncbi:MAG: hypothetical protein ACXV79_00845 [Methylobacter sp.]
MAADTAFWFAGLAFTIALIFFALSLDFTFDEISLGAIHLNLPKPFEWKGVRSLLFLCTLFVLFAITFGAYGAKQKMFPWPERFKDVESADIFAQRVDDLLIVEVNGQKVLRAEYGKPLPPVPILDYLKRGLNTISIMIQNGRYGGCGGEVTLRLNGLINQEYEWKEYKYNNQPQYVVCFQHVWTLQLN